MEIFIIFSNCDVSHKSIFSISFPFELIIIAWPGKRDLMFLYIVKGDCTEPYAKKESNPSLLISLDTS